MLLKKYLKLFLLGKNTISKKRFIWILAFYLSVLSIPFIVKSFNFKMATLALLLGFFLNIITLSIFRFNKLALKIWSCFVLISSSSALFFVINDGMVFSRHLMKSVFVASKDEIFSNFHITILIYLLFFGILPCYFVVKTKFINVKQSLFSKLSPVFIVVIFALSYLFFQKEFILIVIKHRANIIGYDNTETLLEAGLSSIVHKILTKKYDIRPLTEVAEFNLEKPEKINVILIIGESARADRFSLLGYNRKTNPKLENIKNLYINSALACAGVTLKSVPCMLSPVKSEEFSLPPSQGFVVDVFKKLNFRSVLYSTNDIRETDLVIKNIHESFGEYHNLRYQFDEVILPKLDGYVGSNENQFLVLHSAGSHFQYHHRYPDNFDIFSPSCKESVYDCSREMIDNVYDNTILYTDFIISEIIKKFKNENTVLFYVADHGESLGESGIYKHGIPITFAPDAQKYVPFFVWVSDEYIRLNPEKAKALLKGGINERISHDYLFSSLLDCANISSEMVDKDLSLCHL
jgi:lipid A ethanolaminephosphotransferase